MKIRECMKRNVVSILSTASLGEAAATLAARHVGLLPVVDDGGRLVGLLGVRDLLALALPSFVHLVGDVDFVHDFGAVEAAVPGAEVLARPVSSLMQPVTAVEEDCGLLRAFALMLQHRLHDLPVVDRNGRLTGIASRVDIGAAILASWQRPGKGLA
ncbi:MAG: CBS domain-containing protein [Chloroflexi bacterium]|nr:CBS domain-containing protein [Chloroflexota bacterium]